MGLKYKDFDAMFDEMTVEKVSFKAFGKMYSIDKAMPASIVLEMARQEKGGSISSEFLFRAARSIFGDDILNEISANKGFTVAKLEQLIKWAFETINGGDTTDAEEEEITEDDAAGGVKRKN